MKINKIQYLWRSIFLVSILAFSLSSCTKNVVYNQFQSIDDAKWHKDSIINFKIESTDSLSKHNIYVNLRNNKDFEFSNLFLIVGINFPNNYQIVDTLEYEMTSPDGKFLGAGISDIKENKLEYKTHVTFPVKGNYNIHIQQAMRKTRKVDGLIYLDGITDVGLQIEKVN